MAGASAYSNGSSNTPISTVRFLDLAEEPTTDLAPIRGYEKVDLVPLEEALEPIDHLLDDVAADLWIARRNCKQSLDGLSPDERASIYLYTMDLLYRQLNGALRDQDRRHLAPWFSYLKLLLTALWKLPEERTTVWRGVKADLSAQFVEGDSIIWWGFSSCTISLKQAERFLGTTGPRTLFNIDSLRGKLIENHSNHPGEREVLLLPCSYFEVLGCIDQRNGLHIIHVRQAEPPVRLIRPPFDASEPSRSVSHRSKRYPLMRTSASVPTTAVLDTSSVSVTQLLRPLMEKPRLRVSIQANPEVMSANDQCLVYCRESGFCVLDRYGREKMSVEGTYRVVDLCWSSFLNRFFILCTQTSFSLDVSNVENPLRVVQTFHTWRDCCTCHENILFVYSSWQDYQRIEEYNMSDWKLCQTFRPPVACGDDDNIKTMRFNSDGSLLGVIIKRRKNESDTGQHRFELRNPYDNMKILQVVELTPNFSGGLLALPKQQFLIHSMFQKKFYLLDSKGRVAETVEYEAECIGSTALLNSNCLVIQTDTDLLRFYDL